MNRSSKIVSGEKPKAPKYEFFLKPGVFLPGIAALILGGNYVMMDNAEELHKLNGTPIPTEGLVTEVYKVKHFVDTVLGIKGK